MVVLVDGINRDVSAPLTPGASQRRIAPSLLKWPGGKERELKVLSPLFPSSFRRYYDPFVGGGSVFFTIFQEERFINDRFSDLISFYKLVAQGNGALFYDLNVLACQWAQISAFVDCYQDHVLALYQSKLHVSRFVSHHQGALRSFIAPVFPEQEEPYLEDVVRCLQAKMDRMRKLECVYGKMSRSDLLANLESALKSAFYVRVRSLYNGAASLGMSPSKYSALFFFIREMAYASLFRYNRNGEFNVPYGGLSYNRKNILQKISVLQSASVRDHIATSTVACMDFEEFLHVYPPGPQDFLFLDPPYDSAFSTYAQSVFGEIEHRRLAAYLLGTCQAMFMLVIKSTPLILSLYGQATDIMIRGFEKTYLLNIQDRNQRQAEHLVITNYPLPG